MIASSATRDSGSSAFAVDIMDSSWLNSSMHTSFNRRTATKVKDGRVQRKNRHRPTGHDGYVLDRESPGRGFHHVVSKRDVQAFIDIIPERFANSRFGQLFPAYLRVFGHPASGRVA